MKIAITGHRPHKLGNDYDLTSDLIIRIKIAIRENIRQILINKNLEQKDLTLITGMALGIDTLFAKIAIEYNIPFIAAIPCKEQYIKWPKKSQETWLSIINNPLCEVQYISREPYTPSCMDVRNQWMVDNCDLIIGVHDGSKGGTYNCLEYAKKKGKLAIIIDPKDFNKRNKK